MKIPENEVLPALALAYSREYDEYKRWEDAAKTLFREQETAKAQTAKRMADNLSHRLDGFKAAVAALGISEDELLQTVREFAKGGDA